MAGFFGSPWGNIGWLAFLWFLVFAIFWVAEVWEDWIAQYADPGALEVIGGVLAFASMAVFFFQITAWHANATFLWGAIGVSVFALIGLYLVYRQEFERMYFRLIISAIFCIVQIIVAVTRL